jgi:predicted permease
MRTIWQDLRYGARMLIKSRGFTVAAILSLAIGIGANTAIFSVVNALLLRPLPYPDADRLVILWNRSPGLNVDQDWFSPGQYLDVKAENQVFETVCVSIGASFNLTGQGGPEHVDGARVSSGFFQIFGARPFIGRVFLPEEDHPGRLATAILSHGFWQRRFGGDPAVIGRTLILNGTNFEVVGVTQPGFSLTDEIMPAVNSIERAEVLLPLPMSEGARSNRGNEDYNIFGKLKPGVTAAQAQVDMDIIAGRMKERYPQNYPPHGGLTISVTPLLKQVVGDIGPAMAMLIVAVGFVLLIACANVANLLLARAATRQKEIAIRAAVGAGRLRILRQLLTESALLALLGGLLGLLAAFLVVKAMRVFGPQNIPRLDEVGVNGCVLGFNLLVMLLTGLLFGLAPALRASRVDLSDALKEGGRAAGQGAARRGHLQPRKLLVIFEVALSLILLIGASLLIRSYQRILNSHPGFNPHHVIALRMSLPAVNYAKPELVLSFYQRIVDRIKALPGVEAAGVTYSLPMSTVAFAWGPITIEGYIARAAHDQIISNIRIVSPDYFRTMQIPLLEGRYFTEQDKRDAPETVIVDEALAQRFWPNESPVGKRLQNGNSGPWRKVVGVIRGAKQYSSEKEPPITVFYPHEQYPARSMYLVARTTPDPLDLKSGIIREIQAVDPEMPVYDVSTMDQRLSDSLARRRFSMLLFGVFAFVALVLASVGIFGVMSYSVTQRTHELGVRIALGAQSRQILSLIVGHGMALAAIGMALGLIVSFALTRLMKGFLFGISETDPLTFITIPSLLLTVALLACWVPARRATKVDPMVALRCD